MKNQVGKKLPTASEMTRHTAAVNDVTTAVGKVGIELTSDERRRTLKFRSGGEKVVAIIADSRRARAWCSRRSRSRT